MISKYILPVFALAAVFLVVAVPYSSAAGEQVVEKQIELSLPSEQADRYDKTVNLADPQNAITNPSTWASSPRGIWIGASTEESLYQLNDIMYDVNSFDVFHEVRFNSTQIMNGASVSIIRSPIHIEDVRSLTLKIWTFDDPDTNWTLRQTGTTHIIHEVGRALVADVDVDLTDTSITAGSDGWIMDDRAYIELHAPLLSGTKYIFHWHVEYEADASPAIYLSSQDIANDDLMLTRVAIYNQVLPDAPAIKQFHWEVDPGISFDMLQGLGSNLYSESVYMHAGDSITFSVELPSRPEQRDYYHTLMVPFVTDDGRLSAEVKFQYDGIRDDEIIWMSHQTEWYDYILACSAQQIGTVESGRSTKMNITFIEDTRINLMFFAGRDPGPTYLSMQGVERVIWANLWASYQLSLGQVQPPSVNPADWPGLAEVQENERVDFFGTIIGLALIVVGAAVIATGVGMPLGLAMVAGGLGMVILEGIAHKQGYPGLPEYVHGLWQSALDMIIPALEGVGKFIIAIGEGIWDAITWFADAVLEYGSVLLGLLIIAVSLALFFAPIYTQLKLWGIAWRMAEGDVQAAAAQAQDLASQASGVMSKFRRH